MSDFLAAEGIRTFSGYSRRAHHERSRSRRRRQRHLARQPRARGGARAASIRYCSLPEAIRDHFLWGARSIVIAGTHGKTTTTSLTGWLLTHGELDPTVLVGGIALNFGDRRLELPRRQRAALRHRRRRVRQRVLRQDREVPEVPARRRRHQQRRVRSRRHLRRPRRGAAGVPAAGRPRAAQRPAAARRRQPARARRCATARVEPGGDVRARRAAPTWRAHDVAHRDGMTHFDGARRRASRSARFESPLLGVHNVRNALAAIAVGAHAGLTAPALADGLRAFKGIKRRLETRGRGARRHRARRLRAPSDRRARDACRRCARAIRAAASGRCSSRGRRRRAAASSRTTSPRRSAAPTKWSWRRCSARRCRRHERLSAEQLVADLSCPAAPRAHAAVGGRRSSRRCRRRRRPGDLVVVMSNGGFGGIHGKLLTALSA